MLRAPAKPNEAYIRTMFDAFAERYDIFSWLIGMGQAGRMRRQALRGVRPGMRVLDVASGTGDLAVEAARQMNGSGEVVALDFSAPMLEVARRKFKRRLPDAPAGLFSTAHRSADELPIDGNLFDLAVSGYALRNLYERIDSVLRGLYSSLRPGGGIALLDLTEPPDPVRRFLFRAYLYVFVGLYGTVLFGKNYPVSYLPDSADRFFKAHDFTRALEKAGFVGVRARSFMLGAVTLYEGRRPA